MKNILKLFAVIGLFTALMGCSNKNENRFEQKSMVGIVQEVNEESLLIKPEKESEEGSEALLVSRKTEDDSGKQSFSVGDHVTILYDGKIALSDPGQINHVYQLKKEDK